MPTWKDIVQRANTDPQFRSRFKADPVAAAMEAGVNVPDDLKIEIIDQDQKCMHLVLGAKGYSPKIDAMLSRALSDATFKSQLVSNPKSCVESALGERLPHDFSVVVHEKRPGRVLLSLKSEEADHELNEVELEAVAGGGIFKRIRDLLCRDTPTGTIGANTDADGQVTGVHVEFNTSPGTETVYY